MYTAPLVEWLRRKPDPVTCDSNGVGSIPAIPNAQNVLSVLCHERFNEASLPACMSLDVLSSHKYVYVYVSHVCACMRYVPVCMPHLHIEESMLTTLSLQ